MRLLVGEEEDAGSTLFNVVVLDWLAVGLVGGETGEEGEDAEEERAPAPTLGSLRMAPKAALSMKKPESLLVSSPPLSSSVAGRSALPHSSKCRIHR